MSQIQLFPLPHSQQFYKFDGTDRPVTKMTSCSPNQFKFDTAGTGHHRAPNNSQTLFTHCLIDINKNRAKDG